MANYDHPIQELQRNTSSMSQTLTTLKTENTDLKTKLAALEGQVKALGNQPTTTVVNQPAPITATPQQTVVAPAQASPDNGLKQLLVMMLMSMMKPQSASLPASPYANPLLGSPLLPSNPLLGANPISQNNAGSFFGGFNWNTLSPTYGATNKVTSPFSTGDNNLYSALSPVRL